MTYHKAQYCGFPVKNTFGQKQYLRAVERVCSGIQALLCLVATNSSNALLIEQLGQLCICCYGLCEDVRWLLAARGKGIRISPATSREMSTIVSCYSPMHLPRVHRGASLTAGLHKLCPAMY